MRLPSNKAPRHKHVEYFVRHHLGDRCFAPFTGQDYPAWRAFVYLVECWCAGGDHDAIIAMRATIRCAQPQANILRVFVQVIPAIGDWHHVKQIWPNIVDGLQLRDTDGDIRELWAIERGDERIWHHGLNAPSVGELIGAVS